MREVSYQPDEPGLARPASWRLALCALATVAALALAGCGSDSGAPAGATTSPALDPSGARTARTAPLPVASSARTAGTDSGAPSDPGQALCGARTGGRAPDGLIETVYAPDTKALPRFVRFGAGRFTWVAFWASWCKPCVTEIPRLLEWQKRAGAADLAFELAFVAVDDVREDVAAFLEAQPASGLRASYWLPLELRKAWVDAMGVVDRTSLPAHSIVDPKGEVACHVPRSVDERDYPALVALLRGAR